MNHEFECCGFSFKLRPVRLGDYEFIWRLRSEGDRSQYLHPIDPDPLLQRKWIEDYLQRNEDYYFIVESLEDKKPQGTIGLWGVERPSCIAEWGRWILLPESIAAVESVMLLYEFAFDVLGLSEVFCRTVAQNSKVTSFHESVGVRRKAYLPNCFQLHAQSFDAVEHRLNHVEWRGVKSKLERLSKRMALGGRDV